MRIGCVCRNAFGEDFQKRDDRAGRVLKKAVETRFAIVRIRKSIGNLCASRAQAWVGPGLRPKGALRLLNRYFLLFQHPARIGSRKFLYVF